MSVRGIAHDLNNVLAAILGSADLLTIRLKKDDPSIDEAVAIQKAAERGAALIRQLLAVGSRPGKRRGRRPLRRTGRSRAKSGKT